MKIPRIVHKLRKAVRQNLIEYKHYLIAVSGGADSLALADICSELSKEGFAQFTVCHVEHGLRGEESVRDLAFVKKFCEDRGLPFAAVHVNALSFAKENKLSMEEAARILRYQALREIKEKVGAKKILTAHQADDQAETILWRLLRGAGLEGLSGMNQEQADVLRPLLDVTRQEIISYLAAKGLEYCEDSSNANIYFTRNKIRQELLPYLANNYNVKIKESLARTAKLLQEDANCLEHLAEEDYAKDLLQDEEFCFDAKKLREQDPAICKRVLRLAVFRLGLGELDYERTQALYELVDRNNGNKIIELPQGYSANLKNNKLHFSKQI